MQQALHSQHSWCCLGPAQTQAVQTKCSSRVFSDGWSWQLGGTVNLSRFQEISHRKNRQNFLRAVSCKLPSWGNSWQALQGCVPWTVLGYSLHPFFVIPGSAEKMSSDASWGNHNSPSAFPEDSETVTVQLCPVPCQGPPRFPSSWWRMGFVPTGDRCAKVLVGNMLPSKAEKLKIKEMVRFGLIVGYPCSDWSCPSPWAGA